MKRYQVTVRWRGFYWELDGVARHSAMHAELNTAGAHEAPAGALAEEAEDAGRSIDAMLAERSRGSGLPEEEREVFFVTKDGHAWAGQRHGEEWCDWGDKGILCRTEDVLMWMYAPKVKA